MKVYKLLSWTLFGKWDDTIANGQAILINQFWLNYSFKFSLYLTFTLNTCLAIDLMLMIKFPLMPTR
jgi:hypothetical protein